MAGIRAGFGAAAKEVIRTIVQVKEPFNVNALAQAAAAAAITDEEHVRASRSLNSEGREQLYEALGRLGLGYTRSMSNFVLVRLGKGAKDLYDRLMAKGVIVRYGGIWGLPEHVRVTVGTGEEIRLFISALSEAMEEAAADRAEVR